VTFGELFGGIGGFSLGFERAGLTKRWSVEIDPYCQRVLRKHWPNCGEWDDVRTFPPDPAEDWRVDVIAGGFPCQDISNAGPRVGIEGSRSGLWSEFSRIIRVLRPRFVVVENVPEITLPRGGLGVVLGDLASMGFDARWGCISAGQLGANHERERIWIVAHSDSNRLQVGEYEPGASIKTPAREQVRKKDCRDSTQKTNPNATGGEYSLGGNASGIGGYWQSVPWNRNWQIKDKPTLDGTEDGFPHRLDQLKALGNAQVPRVAATAFTLLSEHSGM
jgi:DNA (cytosine-5)-methyltransferase 1